MTNRSSLSWCQSLAPVSVCVCVIVFLIYIQSKKAKVRGEGCHAKIWRARGPYSIESRIRNRWNRNKGRNQVWPCPVSVSKLEHWPFCHAKLSNLCANSTTKCIDHVRGCKTRTVPLLLLPYRTTLSKDSLSRFSLSHPRLIKWHKLWLFSK